MGEGGGGAAVGRGRAEGVEGVGEGVRLQLEADLDDVEGGHDESEPRRNVKYGCRPAEVRAIRLDALLTSIPGLLSRLPRRLGAWSPVREVSIFGLMYARERFVLCFSHLILETRTFG